MESVDDSSLLTGVFLTLVQQVAVNEDQVTGLDLSRDVVMLVFWLILTITICRGEPRSIIIHHLCASIALLTDKSIFYWRPAMRAWQETETSVLKRGIFQGVPEAHSGRRTSRILEAKTARYSGWADLASIVVQQVCKGRRQSMEIMANLVYSASFGLDEFSFIIECVFLEEESNLVA
ncbi:hypothetical protein HG531_007748 [Fusarium graminearum]|nr:hypothetical protein HG531_007748 [Fusarium graminearum]